MLTLLLRAPLRLTSDQMRLATEGSPAARWFNMLARSGSKPGETLLWWPTPDQWSKAADKYTEELQRQEVQ
jgi:hypothetical protein